MEKMRPVRSNEVALVGISRVRAVSRPVAKKIVIEFITRHKRPFTSIEVHKETLLPFSQINTVLESLAKEGKVR